jgi:hypothetical protein
MCECDKPEAEEVVDKIDRDCRKKDTTIRNKEREVIKSIIEFCDREARGKFLLLPLGQATKPVSLVC